MMGKTFDSVQKIKTNYKEHARQMENIVIESETLNQEYQNAMEATIHNICLSVFIKVNKLKIE